MDVLGNNTQYITMYFGNSSASDSSTPENVFNTSNGYTSVYHFEEDGNNTSNGYKDATSNNNDATGYNMTTNSDVNANIGIGQEFNGSNNYLEINNALLKNILTSTGQITVSFWIKTENTDYATMILWEGRNGGDGFNSYEELNIGYGQNTTFNDGYIHFYAGDENDNTGDPCAVSHQTTDVTNWHHVAITYDVTGSNEVAELFFDGVSEDVSLTGTVDGDYSSNWIPNTRIGRPGADRRYLDGILDELRITNNILSDDHLKMDEAFQKYPSNCLGYGNVLPLKKNIESTALGYTENDGQVIVTSSIEIDDCDDNNLVSARISIGNYQSAEDALSFTPVGSITGSWNASTGVLTLSGTDTKANYLAALRSVTYENMSEDPNEINRTVSFVISDAVGYGNTVSRNISVSKANDNPNDIILSNSSVDENQATGTVVGNLSTSDIDAGDLHTYSLVAGTGSTDNASFQIVGNQLQTNAIFDYETQNSFSIRIRTTDNGTGNLTYEEVFTITVNDLVETISFDATSSNGNESVSSTDLTVSLNAASGLDVTVDYTVSGTATGSGTDYTLANGTLTITAGNTSNNITIASIVDDLIDESDETVIVTLSSPTNATMGTNTLHTNTIIDNDGQPAIAFDAIIDKISVDEDKVLNYNVLLNDIYSDGITLITSIINQPKNGNSALHSNGDLNTNVYYKDIFSVGLSYKSLNSVSLLFELGIKKIYFIGYSYDVATTRLIHHQCGTHELSVNIFLNKKGNTKVMNPRYF